MELLLGVRPLDGEPEGVVIDVETSHTVNDLARALTRQLDIVESMPSITLQRARPSSGAPEHGLGQRGGGRRVLWRTGAILAWLGNVTTASPATSFRCPRASVRCPG